MLNSSVGKYEIKRSKELLKVKHTEEHTLEVVCDFVAQTMGSEHQQAAPAPRASAPQPKPAAPGTGFDSMGSSTDEEIPF